MIFAPSTIGNPTERGLPRKSPSSWALLFCLAAASLLCGNRILAAETIHGAGATFPAPLYAKWAENYRTATGVSIAYEPVGSGVGIERIEQGQVDFGATDAPLRPDELRAADLVQFPAVIGGVVPVVNIRGIKPGELKLDGAVLADIYLGKIRNWNAAEIAALNPTINLPNSRITVVHRADPSGTTFLWTDYLAKTSPEWQAHVGAGKTVAWPLGIGVGGNGNEGVASYVQRTRMSLGYVEYFYAKAHGLSHASLRNRDGAFVQPDRDSFRAAAEAADWSASPDFFSVLTDQPGAKSWPIAGASFILLPSVAHAPERTREVLRFFDWALRAQGDVAEAMDYAALPTPAVERAIAAWTEHIHDASGRAVLDPAASRPQK